MQRINISVGHATAVQMSIYTSLVEVTAGLFGDGSGKKASTPVEDLSGLDTDSFIARVNRIGSI